MAFDNSYTAVTGATYQASDYNTSTKGNFTEIWKGTTAGDMDYYTSATAKNRLALVTGGLLYGGASAPAWLAAGTNRKVLTSTGSAPAWSGLVNARLGGSATDWGSAGSTSRAISNPIIQVGALSVSTGSLTAVTFPTVFTYRPLVYLTVYSSMELFVSSCSDTTNTGFNILLYRVDASADSRTVYWLAIGE